MPKPVYLLTAQEAHKEYNSLTDQTWAKYEQLDSGKYGAVGTPAFKSEACKLQIYLLVWTNFARNWTCWLIQTPGIIQAHILQALKMLFRLNSYTRQAVWLGYGGCSFVPIDI